MCVAPHLRTILTPGAPPTSLVWQGERELKKKEGIDSQTGRFFYLKQICTERITLGGGPPFVPKFFL